MLSITNQFKRDLKKANKQNKDLKLLEDIMERIVHQIPLSSKFRDHSLSHNWEGHRELHIQNDWLLIYKMFLEDNVVIFVRLGSHSELF